MSDLSQSETKSDIKPRTGLFAWLRGHQRKLWWLHSLWALLLGVFIMWLGNQNYTFLRVTVYHVSFIWLSSLLLQGVIDSPRLSVRWAGWLLAVINYFNKNFYQQVLFFILPIYYASSTFGSGNFIFIILIAASAVLASLDLVYDRQLAARRSLSSLFFAFNLFVLINVMLPVLWSVGNAWAMRLSAVLAAIGFLTLYFPPARWRSVGRVWLVGIAALPMAFAELGRAYVPPAPLQLVWSEFGSEFDKSAMRVANPVQTLEPGGAARLWGLTAIRAPMGLKERVRHRWYLNGKLIFTSALFEIVGGRTDGYRLWTVCNISELAAGSNLYIDAETEGGQLIGRARIAVEPD